MEAISRAIQQELVWSQPNAFKEEYQLSSAAGQLGTLKFRNGWGTLATAESAAGCWTFKRVGFFTTRVTIRKCDADSDLATYRNNTWSGGGTLELPDGRIFRATTNFWLTRLELLDAQDERILSYSDIGGFFRQTATLVIEPQAALLADLDWIAIFSWYLVVMMHRDSAATIAATTASY